MAYMGPVLMLFVPLISTRGAPCVCVCIESVSEAVISRLCCLSSQ